MCLWRQPLFQDNCVFVKWNRFSEGPDGALCHTARGRLAPGCCCPLALSPPPSRTPILPGVTGAPSAQVGGRSRHVCTSEDTFREADTSCSEAQGDPQPGLGSWVNGHHSQNETFRGQDRFGGGAELGLGLTGARTRGRSGGHPPGRVLEGRPGDLWLTCSGCLRTGMNALGPTPWFLEHFQGDP